DGRHTFTRRAQAVAVGRRRTGPRLLRPAGGPERTQVGPQRGRVAVKRVDGLERAQGRIELGRVAVEGVEGGLDALLLEALLGDRQILDARQRLARRRLWSGPGFVLHL